LQIIEIQSEALEWIKNPEYFNQSCIPVINETLAEVKQIVERLVKDE
jgi:hypothetical protein